MAINIQSETEFMKLRAESHEEQYQTIYKEIQELLESKNKWTKKGSGKEAVERMCVQREIHSRKDGRTLMQNGSKSMKQNFQQSPIYFR